jgi:dihydrofolate synthase/folylpolyglutamate synthase
MNLLERLWGGGKPEAKARQRPFHGPRRVGAAPEGFNGLDDFESKPVPGERVPREVAGALLDVLGRPQDGRPTVLVSGTKGKGSVCVMTAAALQQAGYRVGLFSKPHVHTWRERMIVDGRMITNEEAQPLIAAMEEPLRQVRALPEVPGVSAFELLVPMAYQYFKEQETTFNVIEVGVGGLRDATNNVVPTVSVINVVGFDHVGYLGNTLPEIAYQKAGIIRPGRPVVTAPQDPEALEVIRTVAEKNDSRLIEVGRDVTWEAGRLRWEEGARAASGQDFTVHGRRGDYDLFIPFLGSFQVENAATVVAAMEVLEEEGHHVPTEAIRKGLATTEWPCRMEVLDAGAGGPLVVADVAHNPMSIARLRDSLPEFFRYDKLAVVMAMKDTKDYRGVVAELAKVHPGVAVTHCRLQDPVPCADLIREFAKHGILAAHVGEPAEALEAAKKKAGRNGLVLATGTFSVPAMVREHLKGITPEVDLAF